MIELCALFKSLLVAIICNIRIFVFFVSNYLRKVIGHIESCDHKESDRFLKSTKNNRYLWFLLGNTTERSISLQGVSLIRNVGETIEKVGTKPVKSDCRESAKKINYLIVPPLLQRH